MNEPANPYQAPARPTGGGALDSRQLKIFKAWLNFFLVATLLGFLAGAACGAVLGAVLGALGHDQRMIQIWATISGFVVGIPVSFVIYRWSVLKYIVPQFSDPSRSDPAV